MQCTITARFDSADEADRAAARLRRAIPFLRAETVGPARGDLSAKAPYAASVYFPWRINMTVNDRGSMGTELGSRAVLTSDRMGLPLWHDGETELRLTLDPQDAERVRALLLNLGGRSVHLS